MGKVEMPSRLEASLEAFRIAAANRGRDPDYQAAERADARATVERMTERFAATGCSVTDELLEMFEREEATERSVAIQTDAAMVVGAWWNVRGKPWLVLSGPTGCGKSGAAAQLLYESSIPGARCVTADMLARLHGAYFGEGFERMERLRHCPLLVVDEVGTEIDRARFEAALLDIVDARKSAKRTPTVLTTNLSGVTFCAYYQNARLHSRMSEQIDWHDVKGEDLRKRKR